MIQIRHGEKYYNKGKENELHVMNDVNLELPASGLIAIFGPSGCGKTTLLNAVGGLDRMESGEILIDGQNLRSDIDLIRNKYIGYIFQNYNLCKTETVYENVADALRICGMRDEEEIRSRVEIALKNVGMEKFKRRLPDNLSGGQQQRVAIARALVKNPQIILADEPTGNLDELNTLMVMDILKEISKDHLVLLVTHEADLADYYCDRVVDVSDGKIVGIRENADANGYVGRNKNHVYLGELSLESHELPGVEIECYGEMEKSVKIRLVSVEGRIYLKCDTPEVKILDESSEVKLLPGSFQEKKTQKADNEEAMIPIPPVEGKDYGKLFGFAESVKMGFRENFTKERKKKRRLLRLCMMLMACVVVFMVAIASVSLRKLIELHENHKDNVFFIPVTDYIDGSKISEHMGEHGLQYARVIRGDYLDFNEILAFRGANFMTAATSPMSSGGVIQNIAWAKGMKKVCGETENLGAKDMVITTALADEMIESSGVSYIRNYEDLIGMVSQNRYDSEGYLRIVGVVESKDKCYYMDRYEATKQILSQLYYGLDRQVLPVSKTELYKGDLQPGQIAVIGSENRKNIRILGKDYSVVAQQKPEVSNDLTYYEWLQMRNIKLLPFDKYFETVKLNNPDANEKEAAMVWVFEEFQPHFCDYCYENSRPSLEEFLYREAGNSEFILPLVVYENALTQDEISVVQMYMLENGRYPSADMLNKLMEENAEILQEIRVAQEEYRDSYQDIYLNFMNSNNDSIIVMNDEDYLKLSYQVGKSDIGEVDYWYYEEQGENGENFNFYDYYLMVGSDDIEATREYLADSFGKKLITPEEVYDQKKQEARVDLVGSSTTLLIVLAVICICIFFIMRSALMNRVKEIGIYRAIGVSKSNITFRFMTEAIILATFTLTIGYAGATWLVRKLAGSVITSQFFYYPWWLAVIVLVLIYGLTILFGTLPARLLLRKTPSEILSKYDI